MICIGVKHANRVCMCGTVCARANLAPHLKLEYKCLQAQVIISRDNDAPISTCWPLDECLEACRLDDPWEYPQLSAEQGVALCLCVCVCGACHSGLIPRPARMMFRATLVWHHKPGHEFCIYFSNDDMKMTAC